MGLRYSSSPGTVAGTIKIVVCACAILGGSYCQLRTAPETNITEPIFETGTGPALIQVLDAENESPLFGARVWFADSRARNDAARPAAKTASAAGFVFFTDENSGMRVLHITHTGYEPGLARVTIGPRNTTIHTVHLARAKTVRLAGSNDSTRIQEENYSIDIPAGTFAGPADAPIEIRYAMAEPTPAGIRAMPGSFRGQLPADAPAKLPIPNAGPTDADSNTVTLASFGAISISAFRGDQELNLAPGKKIRARFACQSACTGPNPPATVPLWSLDESTGLWRAEDTARVVREMDGYWIEADLPHLSWWNADQPLHNKTSILVQRFVAPDGQVLSDPSIYADALDRLTTISGSFGMRTQSGEGLCLEVPPDLRVRLRAMAWRGDVLYEGEQELQTGPAGSDCFENRKGGSTIAEFRIEHSPRAEAVAALSREEISRGYGRFEIIRLHDGSELLGSVIKMDRSFLSIQTIQGRARVPLRRVSSITFP